MSGFFVQYTVFIAYAAFQFLLTNVFVFLSLHSSTKNMFSFSLLPASWLIHVCVYAIALGFLHGHVRKMHLLHNQLVEYIKQCGILETKSQILAQTIVSSRGIKHLECSKLGVAFFPPKRDPLHPFRRA